MDERVILRTMDKCEMSRGLLIDPFLSRHFGGISRLCAVEDLSSREEIYFECGPF
jgi:hypothetical protein